MMRFKTRLKPSSSLIDLTPLVDVIFLLLIFFLVTSDILPLKSLHVENPELPKDTLALTAQLIVVMDAQHVIYVGSKKDIADFSSIKESLQKDLDLLKEHHSASKPTIVLNVDRRVDYGTFLRLFSLVQECHCPIRLAYKPEE